MERTVSLKYLKTQLNTDLKIILFGPSKLCRSFKLVARILKLFATLSSTFIHHYFDDPTKLFSDLYLAKFLNILGNCLFRAIYIYFKVIDMKFIIRILSLLCVCIYIYIYNIHKVIIFN